ncbi:MAG: transposase, partial [Duncaniella sp.]|nr:transposase [Duncaniella sp.]
MSDRHQFRAKWHDYNEGMFFVTICTKDKQHLFGEIKEGLFYPTPLGLLVDKQIENIGDRHDNVQIFNYVVMPNHIHMVA